MAENVGKRFRGERDVSGSHIGVINQLSKDFPEHFIINGSEHTDGPATSHKIQQGQRALNRKFPRGKRQACSPMLHFQGFLSMDSNLSIPAFALRDVSVERGTRYSRGLIRKGRRCRSMAGDDGVLRETLGVLRKCHHVNAAPESELKTFRSDAGKSVKTFLVGVVLAAELRPGL